MKKIEAYRRRKTVPDSLIPNNRFGDLYRRDTKEYGATCLWNCHPTPTPEGAKVVARRLIEYGDLRAWHMAHRLLKISNDATEGSPEVIVSRKGQSGLLNFFEAVPDELFGYRLHMADIAVNKDLAVASRREVRDYVNLALIHIYILPLWHAIWAVPGKDASFNPASLINRISKTNQFPQSALDEAVDTLADLDASSVATIVREALDEASTVIHLLPPALAGSLFVDDAGNPVDDVNVVLAGLGDDTVKSVQAVENGTWPSNAEIDSAILEKIIGRHGLNGEYADRQPGL